MVKVLAPNKQYSGLSAGVMFVNGIGETDNEHLLQWFEEKGYIVERPEVTEDEALAAFDPLIEGASTNEPDIPLIEPEPAQEPDKPAKKGK